MLDKFINQRKSNWQRLEDLLGLIENATLRGLSRVEVRELGFLYRRVASDLAIARAESRDPKLVNYLNSLVIRAHGKVYRAEARGLSVVSKFFYHDFPNAFRQNLIFMAIAFGCFISAALIGFFATWQNLDFGEFVYLDGIREAVLSNNHWWENLNTEGNQVGAAFIMQNNIRVTFSAFAMGAFFGIGAIYDLLFEGARFGSVFAICYKLNPEFGNALASFVVGHGVIELSCINICGGAGMMIGYSILVPGDLSRLEAVKNSGFEAVKIVLGCAFLLVIAGTIEGFISPSPINPAFKVAVGVLTGIAMYSYLFLVGRDDKKLKQPALLNS
ncbi:MAG: stage II sporulation protein M [Pyrinomonadaceae bacterium]